MKRRLFSLLLVAAMALSLLPAVSLWANAETAYDLWIAGVQATSGNKNDILGNGVFSYDPSAKKLTVSGDYTSGVEASMIENDISGLTIYVAEDSTLTTEIRSVIVTKAKKDLTITGPGKLTLRSMNESACGTVFAYSEATVTVADAYVDASGCYAFAGSGGKTVEYLVIRNSYVHAVGYGWPAICDFKGGITLTDCEILEPTGGYIDNEYGMITKKDGSQAKDVVIGKKEYALKIAGVWVTDANKDDILGDGVFSYKPSAKILTVRGNCSVGDVNVINSSVNGLTIEVVEDSTLTNTKGAVIYARGDSLLTITGPGKLTLNGPSQYGGGIYAYGDSTVEISYAYVVASGWYGLAGHASDNAKLFIRRSFVQATGNGGGAISDFNDGITLVNCEIYKPSAGYIDGSKIVTSYGTTAKEVIIGGEYGLTVAGTEVTGLNALDILGDGAFSYNPAGKILTVSGDYTGNQNAILNEIDGLTVYVEKDATLTNTKGAVILTNQDLKITGPGMLTLACTGTAGGICIEDRKTVTIENARVHATGRYAVWSPLNTNGEKLVVRNSYFCAEGEYGAIYDLKGGIRLDDCELLDPAGATVGDAAVLDRSGDAAKAVTIGIEYDLKIGGTQVHNGNAPDILGNGKFSYNAETNVLTVKGVYTCERNAISNNIKGLTVYTAEAAELKTTADYAVISTSADLTITGPGSLVLICTGGAGGIMFRNGATVTIENAYVEARGSYGVWASKNSSGEKLVVKDSRLTAAGTSGAVTDIDGGITISGYSEIAEPVGGKVAGGNIMTSSGTVAKTVVIDVPKYNIWIAGRQVTAANRKDVFGDGHVKFYEKGEYTPTALDEKYNFGETSFKNSRVLVLDNYKSTFPSFYENGDNSAQLYIDEDIYVVLKGENALYKGTWWDMEYNDMICHGIYIGQDYIHFIGDGSLVAYADFCEKEGLYGEGSTLYFSEEVKVTLYGKYGMYQKFTSDIPEITVLDNAVLTCHGMGTDDVDFPGLYCARVYVEDHGELICTTTGLRCEAMSTWRENGFSVDLYDVRILKTDESGSEPFTPEVGVDVKGGVDEGNCRYIDIKGKTTYATGIRFSYDSYKLTPEKSSVTVWPYLLPLAAPELYSDLTWTTSDASVATVQKTGKTGCVITAVSNGTAIITATAPGGATGSVTVTVEGFTEMVPISNVCIEGFKMPQAGQKVGDFRDLTAEAGAPYFVDDVWWSLLDGSYLSDNDVFEKDVVYTLEVIIKPDDGYCFEYVHAYLVSLGSQDGMMYVEYSNDWILCHKTFTVKSASPVLYGDVNGDGAINKKDSLALKKYLADNSYVIDKEAADVFKDNTVNKKDSLRLKQYLAGWNVTLGA